MDKEQLLQQLQVSAVTIVFKKKDGTERSMYATRNQKIIESLSEPVTSEKKREKKENPDVCSVFDIEAKGWRSFIWENLISYQ